MGLSRLTSEPNVYRNNEQTMFVMVYVDDLLFLGQQQEVDKTFKEVQKRVLLRPTGTLGIGQTIQFRDFFEVSLKPEYITTLLKETKMEATIVQTVSQPWQHLCVYNTHTGASSHGTLL